MKLGLIGAIGATLVLSACGGSNSSENVDASVTLEQLKARVQFATDTFTTVNGNAVPTAFNEIDVPAGGIASFTGIVAVDNRDISDPNLPVATFAAIGASTMTANFDEQSITGTANNFFQLSDPGSLRTEGLDRLNASSGQRIDGTLSYNLSQQGTGNNDYAGTMTGSLTPLGSSPEQFDMNFEGFFSGESGQGFAGFGETDDEAKLGAIFMVRD